MPQRFKLPAVPDFANLAPARADQNGQPHQPNAIVDVRADNSWPMTVQDVLRIAIDNTELVRVFALSGKQIPLDGFAPTPLDDSTEYWSSRTARLVSWNGESRRVRVGVQSRRHGC